VWALLLVRGLSFGNFPPAGALAVAYIFEAQMIVILVALTIPHISFTKTFPFVYIIGKFPYYNLF
jgi:hypothetical protein